MSMALLGQLLKFCDDRGDGLVLVTIEECQTLLDAPSLTPSHAEEDERQAQ